MGWGFANLFQGARYGIVTTITGGTGTERINNMYDNFQYYRNHNRNIFRDDISFKDAFKGDGNFWRFLTQEISNQVPIFTALATGYWGLGVLGYSSMGEQHWRMTDEERRSGGLVTHTNAEKMLVSTGFGAAEIVFDRLLTMPLMNRSWKWMTNNKRSVMDGGLRNYIRNSYRSGMMRNQLLFAPLAESSSEGLTTVFQNVLTGRPITENLGHAMFSGGMFGTTFG